MEEKHMLLYLKVFHTSEGTLNRRSQLCLQSLAPTNPHWARVVGYGPFSLCVICLNSGDINRLMMITYLWFGALPQWNSHWACVVVYGSFSLCVIHKEYLCPSSGDIIIGWWWLPQSCRRRGRRRCADVGRGSRGWQRCGARAHIRGLRGTRPPRRTPLRCLPRPLPARPPRMDFRKTPLVDLKFTNDFLNISPFTHTKSQLKYYLKRN
jgi:hypothetical protein